MVLLDNLMSLLTVESATEKNESQAKFIDRCHALGVAYNTAIVIVLHPNKTYRKGQSMDFEQISGNSDIPNKADVILNVIRLDERHEDYTSETNAKIEVLKNRDFADLPSVDCFYNLDTNAYSETGKKLKVVATWQQYLPGYEKITQQGFEPLDDSEPIPF